MPSNHLSRTSYVVSQQMSEIIEVPLKDMRYDLEAMAAAMNEKTKLVFIANPNNPTGTYVSKAEMDAFMKAVPEQVIVVLDEAYLEYVDAPDYPSALDYLETRDRVMVTRTFSKCYGLSWSASWLRRGEAWS